MKKLILAISLTLATLGGIVACNSTPKPQPQTQVLGQWHSIERPNQTAIKGIYYPKQSAQKLPLVINVHGGAFVGGSAQMIDAQSKRIGDNWGVAVYNLDYKLLTKLNFIVNADKYIQMQVDEVSDTVKYFKQNAQKYNIDPDKIILLGYSSGGYVVSASTLDLAKQGQSVWGQVIAYGFIKDALERYNALPAQSQKLTNTLFVFTEEKDFISEGIRPYYDALNQKGVNVSKIELPKAQHGFMEEISPQDGNEQAGYVVQAEQQIGEWIKGLK
ncbi:acetyl esterase/lipase [Neisseria sp. HSC-16F19]|nr:alpha/beta hydrolase [Neisseria sp. HSC-16F19]MCP2041580.1 acetyl esterase/lipase [Neisseria sp. HSC-16F19]